MLANKQTALGNAASATLNVANGSGNDRIAVAVLTQFRGEGADSTNATLNSVAGTVLIDTGAGQHRALLVYWLDAALPASSGNYTVATNGSAGSCVISAFYWSGAKQSAPADPQSYADFNNTRSYSLTADTGSVAVLGTVWNYGGTQTTTIGTSQTVVADNIGISSGNHTHSYKEADLSIQHTYNAFEFVCAVAAAIEPSGGAPADPEFTAGPSVSSVTSSGFTAGGTANVDCTARLVVTNAGASQPSEGTFDASSETASVTAATPFTIPHTGETGNALRWAWIQLDDGVTRVTSYAPALLPTAGWEMVLLTSVNPDPDVRIKAIPDLEAGKYLQWNDITGTGTVDVNLDASFDATVTVTAFKVAAGDLTDGWGAVATQTLVADETAPTLTSATVDTTGDLLTLVFDEPVEFGAGGNDGFALTMSGGATLLSYSSGAGTDTLVYIISRSVFYGETGTLAYTQPGDGVQNAAGVDLASFTGVAVDNNSTEGMPVSAGGGIVRPISASVVSQLIRSL